MPVYTENETPYQIRTAPAGNNRTLEKLIGVSCAFNQLADLDSDSWTVNGLTVTATNGRIQVSGTSEVSSTYALFPSRIYNKLNLKKDHKYILYYSGTHNFDGCYYAIYGNTPQTVSLASTIFNCTPDNVTDSEIVITATSGNSYTADFYFYVIDLTACFGSEVADYLYNLENT